MEASNIAVEQAAGSRSLAVAAHRERLVVTDKRWTSTILRLPLIPKIGLRLMRVNESYWWKSITEMREFLCPSAREHFMRRCTWLLRINSLWRTSQLSERSIAWSEKASQDTTRFTLSALWSPRKFTFSLKSKTSGHGPYPVRCGN